MLRSPVALRFLPIILLTQTDFAFGGARIDLRPTPPVPPGGYQPNTTIQVDAFFVDTGNPQGAIGFRGLFLDFNDSPPWNPTGTLTYPDPPGPLPGNWFVWENPFGIGMAFGLPNTSWVYPLPTPNPLFQLTMPDNGEVLVGHVAVNVGAGGGTLDVMNDDNPDPNFGARADFGFGGAGDPVTTWRAFTGELTGGTLELPVVPEPSSAVLFLLAAGFVQAIRKRTGC